MNRHGVSTLTAAVLLASPCRAGAWVPPNEELELPAQRGSWQPRRSSVVLGPLLATLAGTVVAGELSASGYYLHRLANCTDIDSDCADSESGLLGVGVAIHRGLADTAAGLGAGAGWHLAWRRPTLLSAARERRLRRLGVALGVVGIAAEVAGHSLYLSYLRGPETDTLKFPVAAMLPVGTLLRSLGLGLATFSWSIGAQR